MDTELIQAPTPDNEQVAIVHAVAVVDGKTFSGIGDASPENVGRNIAPHLIRMAETRAKARALRDAVNVAATSLEELGEDNPEDRQRQSQSASQNTSEMPERTEGGATRKQLNFMLSMLPEHRKNQLEEEHGSVENWSKDAVRAMIDKLKSKQEGAG